ncbi:MAG: sulfite exporter TauE/SafE family protein [Spirochaetia bacterium]|nr:sulfite exporter TauE/SafE family protein [Spirochaetia bacterium]
MNLTTVLAEAFILGLAGSFHCLGMCGPFVHILNSHNRSKWAVNITYNLARTISYMIIGLIFGFIGKSVNILLLSEAAAFLGAGILIVFAIFYLIPTKSGFTASLPSFIIKKLSKIMKEKKNIYLLSSIMGVTASILPCGLLYAGYAFSLTTGNPYSGALTMLFFSLGAYPALITLGFSSGFLLQKIPAGIWRNLLAVIMIALGILIIYFRLGHDTMKHAQ